MAEQITNEDIARKFDHVADLLELRGENPFRVRSYRQAASTLREIGTSAAQTIREEGVEPLERLHGIGQGLARSIQEIVETGTLGLLERLEAETAPEQKFQEIPGIGPKTARQIHRELGIENLEELEMAANDGRLAQLEGIGPKRVEGIRDTLAGILSRTARRRQRAREQEAREEEDRPSVELLLRIDREYRDKAEEGRLRTIAPKRFNPEGKAWLPLMHKKADGWKFTVLFSNTRRAHELGRTHDWVVIYWENGHEQQNTVVTAQSGPLQGKRVVRGREQECREYYGL